MSAPILTAFEDAAPCPRVEIYFEDFDPGTASATVFRISGGRSFEVRGAVRAPTAGSLTRVDFEVPFNVLVSYRAEQFDADGLSLGFTESASLEGVSVAETWMHNPLNPQGAVEVTLLDSAVKSLSRVVPGEVSYPRGRRVGVVLSEPRRGLAETVFDAFTETHADADRVQALIGGANPGAVPVVCIRTGSDNPMRVAMPLFLGVFDIVEEDVSVRSGGEETIQRLKGPEVDPPLPGLYVPLLRRKDINAYYGSRAAVNASALTRSEVNRQFELAGYAGD